MTKHLTLLGHRMIRIFPILLFIGLAWGQAEPDTSEIDYYQMGIDAAVQDYKDLKPTFGRITSDIWFRNPLKKINLWLRILCLRMDISTRCQNIKDKNLLLFLDVHLQSLLLCHLSSVL